MAQTLAKRQDRGPGRGIVGERDHRLEVRDVGAGRDGRQLVGCRHGAVHAIGPRAREVDVDELSHLVALALEARGPQIEDRRRLHAVHMGRRAGLVLHGRPCPCPLVQDGGEALPRHVRAARAAPAERVSKLALARRVPDPDQALGAAAADRRAACRAGEEEGVGAGRGHQGGERDGDRRREPRPDRMRRQRGEEGLHGREAAVRLRREPAHHRRVDAPRHPAAPLGRAHARVLDVVEELGQSLSAERAHAVERLEQRHAEGELIARRRGPVAAQLLGRHVGRRAEHRPGLRQRQGGVGHAGRRRRAARGRDAVAAGSRQAEIGDPRPIVGADEHVLWLEVAVDDADRVGRGQTATGLDEHGERIAPGSRPGQPGAQGGALDVLHGHEDAVAVPADVEHRHHVRMRQPRQRLGLAHQPLLETLQGGVRRGRRGPQKLEAHLSIELRVVGDVDLGRGAHAHAVDDHEPPDQRAAHQLDRFLARLVTVD